MKYTNKVEFTGKHALFSVYVEEERAYVCKNYRFEFVLFFFFYILYKTQKARQQPTSANSKKSKKTNENRDKSQVVVIWQR